MDEVVVGALVSGGRVLLAHRRPDKRAYPGVWDLPGGHVEDGESEREALARELREELGVDVDTRTARLLCRLVAGRGDLSVRLSAWVVREWRGTPSNVAPEEHDDLGWFGLSELPPMAHHVVRAALEERIGDLPS